MRRTATLVLLVTSFGITNSCGDLEETAFPSQVARAVRPKTVTEPLLDFSGVDTFWEIYGTLKEDREPQVQQWDRLFATPGYAALEEREHKRNVLSEAFRLAYMPSKQEQVIAVMKQDGWLAYVLPHLQKIPMRRSELTAFQAKLESDDWLIRAARQTQKFLPHGLIDQYPLPPVSFVFFAPDGRGYPRIIVADLLDVLAYPAIEKLFAHELFHYYRQFVEKAYQKPTETDGPLINVITNIEEEGIADQLDKSDLPRLTERELQRMFPDPERRGFCEDYRRSYAESNRWLQSVEKVFEEIAQEPAAAKEKGRLLHEQLPIDGRPLGAFMAHTIMRELGENQLVRVVGDPLGFWIMYNKAARQSRDKSYPLSSRAMSVIERLRLTYNR